jgi:hypothetical protein
VIFKNVFCHLLVDSLGSEEAILFYLIFFIAEFPCRTVLGSKKLVNTRDPMKESDVTGCTVFQLSRGETPPLPPADTGVPESLTQLLWILHWVLCARSDLR